MKGLELTECEKYGCLFEPCDELNCMGACEMEVCAECGNEREED